MAALPAPRVPCNARLLACSRATIGAVFRYLDAYGKERQWAAYELGPDGQEFGYTDYVNPLSWYRYYTYVPMAESSDRANETI